MFAYFFRQQIINIIMQRNNGFASIHIVFKLGMASLLSSGWIALMQPKMLQQLFFFHAFTVNLL